MRACIILILLMVSAPTLAVNVRGRVDFVTPYSFFPMARATVQLCDPAGCLSYFTGSDGMYYFAAHPGPHRILVNGVWKVDIFIPNQPYFDIAPIRGN